MRKKTHMHRYTTTLTSQINEIKMCKYLYVYSRLAGMRSHNDIPVYVSCHPELHE